MGESGEGRRRDARGYPLLPPPTKPRRRSDTLPPLPPLPPPPMRGGRSAQSGTSPSHSPPPSPRDAAATTRPRDSRLVALGAARSTGAVTPGVGPRRKNGPGISRRLWKKEGLVGAGEGGGGGVHGLSIGSGGERGGWGARTKTRTTTDDEPRSGDGGRAATAPGVRVGLTRGGCLGTCTTAEESSSTPTRWPPPVPAPDTWLRYPTIPQLDSDSDPPTSARTAAAAPGGCCAEVSFSCFLISSKSAASWSASDFLTRASSIAASSYGRVGVGEQNSVPCARMIPGAAHPCTHRGTGRIARTLRPRHRHTRGVRACAVCASCRATQK